jgi:mRNA interferase RelE/StbE
MSPGSGKRKLRAPLEVAELVRRMHPQLKFKVKEALKDIVKNTNSGKALKDELEGLRSYRVKRFRIIYRVGSSYIEIIAIGPRRLIYEETFRIISREEKQGK